MLIDLKVHLHLCILLHVSQKTKCECSQFLSINVLYMLQCVNAVVLYFYKIVNASFFSDISVQRLKSLCFYLFVKFRYCSSNCLYIVKNQRLVYHIKYFLQYSAWKLNQNIMYVHLYHA